MTKPTGRPVGRPKTKEYATLLARVPQDLVDRVKRYASIHRLPIADLIRDGLAWRIEEGDPHSSFMYDINDNRYSSNTKTQVPLTGMDLTPVMLDTEDLEDISRKPDPPSVDIAPQPAEPGPAVSPRGVAVWDKAAVLAQLDAWKSAGLSLQAMADRLEASQVPTFSGKGHWKKGTIGNLLAAQRQAAPVA